MCRNIGKSIPVWQKKGIGWAMDKNWTTLGVLIEKQSESHPIWDEESREYLRKKCGL